MNGKDNSLNIGGVFGSLHFPLPHVQMITVQAWSFTTCGFSKMAGKDHYL